MNAFDVVNGMLTLYQNGKGIESFLHDNEVKSVIIYGMGKVGFRVYEALKKTDIVVKMGIDNNAAMLDIPELKLISLQQVGLIDEEADLIIVTPMEHYWDIRDELVKYTSIDIISIGEIVEYCLVGEKFSEASWKSRDEAEKSIADIQNKRRTIIERKDRSKYVMVFGGSSGIGKAIAEKMLLSGSKVIIVGRNLDRLQKVKEEIASDNLFILSADITSVDSHSGIFEKAKEIMGGLDAFVNSAAVSLENQGRGYEPWDITSDEWDYMADTDLKAAFFLIRNEINYFRKMRIPGNILNISSNAGHMDISGIYGVSKLAIEKWTRAFGKRFGREGIIINAIAPGVTLTPMVSNFARDIGQPYNRHAIGRFIKPNEIAEIAYECLTDIGVIMCGSTIIADGGSDGTVI